HDWNPRLGGANEFSKARGRATESSRRRFIYAPPWAQLLALLDSAPYVHSAARPTPRAKTEKRRQYIAGSNPRSGGIPPLYEATSSLPRTGRRCLPTCGNNEDQSHSRS